MSLPDRRNPYSFDDFLAKLHQFDFYRDDPFLRKAARRFSGDEWPEVDRKVKELSPLVSGRWRELSDFIARPQCQPFLEHFDAHNHRVDRLIRPAETLELERGVSVKPCCPSAPGRGKGWLKNSSFTNSGKPEWFAP